MYDIFDEFATDPQLENKGTWRELSPAKGDQPATELLIARANNRAYSRRLTSLYEQNSQKLEEKSDAADDLSDKVMIDVIAETILLGWKNLVYKKQPLPYSIENAKMLLAHADFRLRVSRMSNDVDHYKMKMEVEQGKA